LARKYVLPKVATCAPNFQDISTVYRAPSKTRAPIYNIDNDKQHPNGCQCLFGLSLRLWYTRLQQKKFSKDLQTWAFCSEVWDGTIR